MTMASEDLTIQQQLHAAIESGDMDGVSRILTLHPVLINTPFNGNTPLTAAVMAHKMDIVRLLVEKGVQVTRNIFELSEEVADQDGLSDEDRITAHDISAYLEEHRVVEDETGTIVADDESLTAEEVAAQKELFKYIVLGDRLHLVKDILTRHPKLTNLKYDDETPLEVAVDAQDIEVVRWMVEHGATVTRRVLEQASELWQNADDDEEDDARDILRLLEGMADEEEDDVELTIGELTQQRVLNDAINAGDVEKVREILNRFPRLVNIEYNLNTPLRRAIYMVDIDIVRAVLEAGATVDEDDLESGYIGVEDVDRMGGDTTTIQNIIELLRNPPPVAPRARALDFGDEPAMPALEVTEIEYKELPDVFDFATQEELPIFDALAKRRIIFTMDDSYYGMRLDKIESSLKDKTSTFYECKKELLYGGPYTKDVHLDRLYFILNLNGNLVITEEHLRSALASECSIFELVPTGKKLAFMSSYRSVQVSPGINGLGEDVNIVSADHCQKGSNQFTYDLKTVTMVKYRTAEQKEADKIEAEKKAVEDAALTEKRKQEQIVRKKQQEEQAAKVAARGSGRRRTYRKGKKSKKRKTYRK